MEVTFNIHPEIQSAWEEEKQALAEAWGFARDKAADVVEAYTEWGAKNRKMMEKVPGVGPLLNFTGQIAETPGTDFFAFTAPEALMRMATSIAAETGTPLSRSAARGLRRLVTEADESVQPSVFGDVEGPIANVPNEGGWWYLPRESNITGDLPPAISFPPEATRRGLEKSFGGMPDPYRFNVGNRRLMELQNKYGDIAPYLDEKFYLKHEGGHHLAAEALTDDEYRHLFDLGPRYPLNVQPTNQEFLSNLMADYMELQKSGIYLPSLIMHPNRWAYGLKKGQKFLEEPIGDYLGAIDMGGDPYKMFTRTMPNKDPLLQHLRLKEAQDIAKQYVR